MRLPPRVTIYEVGPRDGLQNEARMVATRDKISLVNGLAATGLSKIEITSFVSPKWIPQLADAANVARGVDRPPGIIFSALVPNRVGLDAALEAGLPEVAVFLSASETHNKKNVNRSVAESLRAVGEIAVPALSAKVALRAYVSTAFGCPYEGSVAPERVVELVSHLRHIGAYQVSLGDTVGVAHPAQVEAVLEQVLRAAPPDAIALHMHDTRGTALANCLIGLQMGITTLDAAVGGLGGCPYAPGASGNLATEDLVAMLHAMGVHTGIDLDQMCQVALEAAAIVGHELPSKFLKAYHGAVARAARKKEKETDV